MSDTELLPPSEEDNGPISGELPAYAPPPPKPSLSALVIDNMQALGEDVRAVEDYQHYLDTLVTDTASSLKLAAWFVFAVLAVNALVGIAALVLVGVLIGHLGR